MAPSWTTCLLLLGWAQAFRMRSRRNPVQPDNWWTRRRAPPQAPKFDSNGCVGPACDALDSTEFDFVVVGTGAGGGTVAARLAEAGNSVLVLEAGVDAGGEFEYQVPLKHAAATEAPGIAWNFYVNHYEDPARAAQNSRITPKGMMYPRGGTLGGSTAVNAMIQVLPKVSDWERLAALTNDDGFSPSSMNKFEDLLEWLPKDNIPLTDLLADVFNPPVSIWAVGRLLKILDAAFEELGERNITGGGLIDQFAAYAEFLSRNLNDRLREGNVEGAYTFPQMIKNGNRYGVRERLLQAVDSGKLTIKMHALVSKVVFSNANADGGCQGPCRAKEVIYLDGIGLYGAEIEPSSKPSPGQSRVTVREGGEVILSAGAFNTPQILKQSGIGSKEELERFGLPVHVDLVGVGENLQDRYEVAMESEFFDKSTNEPAPFVSAEDCNFVADPSDLCFKHWSEQGKGLYATNGGLVALLTRSGFTVPSDLTIIGTPGPVRGYAPGYAERTYSPDTRHIFSWLIFKAHTDNRGGTVKLRCEQMVDGKCVVDPRATPDINFHFFDEGVEYDELDPNATDTKGEGDLMATVRALEIARSIQEKTFAKLSYSRATETWPGDNFAPGESFGSETEKLREFVKREAWGIHASCTAPMGCIPSDEVGSHNAGAGVCQGARFNANTVLDSRFRVRGTQGLRVIDASVWPRIPGSYLMLPTFMLSEKGAATIIEDHA